MRKYIEGVSLGLGFFTVAALVAAIAWAGDIFTVDKDGTLKFAVNDQGKITVGATESYVNLVIQNNAAAANNKVDITADVLTVEGIRLENVNVSADLTASGAGGLDTGAEASNTWYYVWVVTNNTGTSSNGLLSTSSASPTLPPGFTKKRRVGAVRNDGSNNFLHFVQEGNKVIYDDPFNNNRVLSGGTATSWTTVNCASFVSPTSRRTIILGMFIAVHSVANTGFGARIRRTGSGATYGTTPFWTVCAVANIQFGYRDTFDIGINASQQMDYILSTGVPDGGGGVTIDVMGYSDRI